MLLTIMFALMVGAPDDLLTPLIPRIEHATVTGSVQQLELCRQNLLAVVARTPAGETNLARYTLAYVDWRIYPLLASDRGKRGNVYLTEAEKQLDELLKADPGNAEAHALLSSVYGLMMGLNPSQGMVLGPKASASIETALKLARNNPRVALQAGLGTFFTPKEFGGGIDKAEKELRRAEMLFAREPTDAPWPNWGRLDILVWMGQLLATKGDRESARSYYQRALALQPDFGWVRYHLLPALDKPAAKR